jgi:hypothetical protein
VSAETVGLLLRNDEKSSRYEYLDNWMTSPFILNDVIIGAKEKN